MGRFLFLTIFLIVATGLVLHFEFEIPHFFSWVGQLPGDILIKKKGVMIYVPLATSVLISSAASIVLSFLFKSGK